MMLGMRAQAAYRKRLDPRACRTETLSVMNVEELRKLTTNGFRPFKLFLSDGRFFKVPHPEFIAFSDLAVVVFGTDRLPNIIDPRHIASAKPLKAKSTR